MPSTVKARQLELLDAPARALCGDGPQARGLVFAVAASAHGQAVFLLEGVLADQPDPLAQARQQAASAAKALTAAYDQTQPASHDSDRGPALRRSALDDER